MPKIVLNGREVEYREGQTVIQVALEQGLEIPHYCWHPALPVAASCRICQVEIEGPMGKRVVTACNTPCSEGLKVETDTDAVARARAGNLEDLLANHPLDCPICDKAGECWLQDYAYEYGPAAGRYDFPRRRLEKRKPISEHVLLDQERCILCTRCVRYLEDWVGKPQLAVVGRGERSVIDIFPGEPVTGMYQGNLADICPVGALTLKEFRFKNRVWYLEGTDSVCPLCSRGCSITLDVRDGELNRVRPRTNPDVNGYFICDEGRFGLLRAYPPAERIERAALGGRDDASPGEAIDAAAEAWTRAVAGGGGLLVAASPDTTCEVAAVLRAVIEGAPALRGKVRFAYAAPERGEGDGLLRTGEKAANARGLAAFGYEELGDTDLARAAGEAGACLWMDPRREKRPEGVGHLTLWAVHSPLAGDADVVWPFPTLAEQDGSLVQCEGRLQRVRTAMPRPPGVPDPFALLGRLAEALGAPAAPRDAFAAFDLVGERFGLGDLTLSALPPLGVPVTLGREKEAHA